VTGADNGEIGRNNIMGEIRVWRLSDGNATVGEGKVRRTTNRFGSR
jgi:hypothetical protein